MKDIQLEDRNLIFASFVFYSILAILGFFILYLFRGENVFALLSPKKSVVLIVGGGLAGSLAIATGFLVAYFGIYPFRAALKPIIGFFKGLKISTLLILSILAGIGEEILFRGAIQEIFGFLIATLLFGLVHYMGQKVLLAYGIFALFAGFILGYLFILTDELLTPIIAHALFNIFALISISKGWIGK